MADIFLSYASADREQVKPLVEALETDGFSVWWDRNIQAGASYDREIETAISEASCVVVVWSRHSVDAEYVRSEVEEAAHRDILVPVLIDDAIPPLAHRRRQAASLVGWTGEADGEYATLVAGIRALVGASDESKHSRAELRGAPQPRKTDSVRTRIWVAAAGVAVFLGLAWWVYERPRELSDGQAVSPSDGPAVVLLMDTLAPHGVYDQATVRRSETNADELSRVMADLPLVVYKETLGSDWGREDQIARHQPSLVMIHRSAFFHAMNAEFGFGYSDEDIYDEPRWRLLYRAADNKLVALLGYVGAANPDTRFLIYSRGTGGGWSESDFRERWRTDVENRFPFLRGRVFTMPVPGGVSAGSFTTPEAVEIVRTTIAEILALPLRLTTPKR